MRQNTLIPTLTDRHASWLVKLQVDTPYDPSHYAQANRRDYYKILLITAGCGTLRNGARQYCITAPAVICLHPRDIISWKATDGSLQSKALYIHEQALSNATIKAMIEQSRLFNNAADRVALVAPGNDLAVLTEYFHRMGAIADSPGFAIEFLLGYLQLLLVEIRQRCFAAVTAAPAHLPAQVKQFFELLEKETAQLSTATPLKLKTAREYASQLSVHPNYLNAMLKKHTGQNVSTHIRTRLVEEAKSLLLQTDWTIKEISYLVGFSDPPNFSVFFKSNTGQTPADFRSRIAVV